jgi:hypothetical protein
MSWKRALGLAVIAAPLMVGCGSSEEQVAASGSTGAFGVVTVDGKQKLYLPLPYPNDLGHGEVAVVDVGMDGNGVTGAEANLTKIDLGGPDFPSTTGGDSNVIVVAGVSTQKVWLVDPHSDTVTKTIDLPPTWGTSYFSGGGGYVTGIAMDSAHHRAILSIWNGFALLDTESGEITDTIEAPPVENFGFDSVHQRIIAPYYDCESASDSNGNPPAICGDYLTPQGDRMAEGLYVVDLADQAIYLFQDPSYDGAWGGMAGAQPVDGEPDGAAINPETGVVVVASEAALNKHVIELGSASFDSGAKQFTAPHHVLDDHGTELTGVSIEPSKNLAFFEGESSSYVGVLDLTAAVQGGGSVIVGTMPSPPDGNGWFNMGDPHGIAVTTGLNGGRSVGFVVTYDGEWVARVDLETFAGLGNGTDPVAADQMASAVTLLHAIPAE